MKRLFCMLHVWEVHCRCDLVLPEIIMLRDVSMEKAYYSGYAMLLGSQYFQFFSYFLCNEFLSFSWVISWVVRMKIGVLHFPQAFLPTFLLQRVKLIYTPAQCLHSSIFEFWFQLVVSVPGNGVHKPLLFCFCGKNNTRKRVPLPYLFNCLQHAGNANTHYTRAGEPPRLIAAVWNRLQNSRQWGHHIPNVNENCKWEL